MWWAINVNAGENHCLFGSVLVRQLRQLDTPSRHIQQKRLAFVERAQHNLDLRARVRKQGSIAWFSFLLRRQKDIRFGLSEYSIWHDECPLQIPINSA